MKAHRVLSLVGSLLAWSQPLDVLSVVGNSVKVNERDFYARMNFDCTVTEREDAGAARTYIETMLDGSPYRLLIAVNSQPITPSQQAREERDWNAEVLKRSHESPQQRARRIEKHMQSRRQEQAMLEQMINAFDFSFVGDDVLHGSAVYVVDAKPRPDYKPPNERARVLTGMRGRIWIEKSGLHWAKVEVHVVQSVPLYGFFARVDPGTEFILQQAPVAASIWLPSSLSVKVCARIAGIVPDNESEQQTFSNYRPAAHTAVLSGARTPPKSPMLQK